MQNYKIVCVIEKDEDGYFAYCPQMQGCYAQGETFEEALLNFQDVVKLHIEDRLSQNEPIPSPEFVNLTTVEVTL